MLVALALALSLVAQPAPPDTVVLRNGSVLRGTVVQDTPESLVIELDSGESWTVPRDTIERVELSPVRPSAPAEAQPPPPEAPPVLTPVAAAPPSDEPPPDLGYVPFFALGVSTGVALPLGNLDGMGLALGSAVSPMWTFTFEGAVRPVPELEVGLQMLFGVGVTRDPLDGYCVAAGASCSSFDVVVAGFSRVNLTPRGAVNPWLMASFGWEGFSVSNDYQDAFDYSGWQAGGQVGVDLRWGGGSALTFLGGARLGEFTSLRVTGYLPEIPFSPALHGWIDVAIRATFGFF